MCIRKFNNKTFKKALKKTKHLNSYKKLQNLSTVSDFPSLKIPLKFSVDRIGVIFLSHLNKT